MAIAICSSCAYRYKLLDAFVGKQFKCRFCSAYVRVEPSDPLLTSLTSVKPVGIKNQESDSISSTTNTVSIYSNHVPTYRETAGRSQSDEKRELRLELSELKVEKSELIIAKKANLNQQRILRAEYTRQIRQRGSLFPGGGSVGHFVRLLQTASHDSLRSQLAQDLEPLEKERNEIEISILKIDSLVHDLRLLIADL